MRRLLTVVLLAAVTGCGGEATKTGAASSTPSPAATTTTLTVPVWLYDNTGVELEYIGHTFVRSGSTCHGRHSFAGFSAGHTVELRDAASAVVASAGFREGTWAAAAEGKPAHCAFSINFTDVPLALDLFKVSIGEGTGPTFTNADLRSNAVSLVYNEPEN